MATPASVDELRPGDHACLTFSDGEERLDIVAAFVRDGLDDGQRVVCFTESIAPDVLAAQLVDRDVPAAEPIRSGQLTIRASGETWLAGGVFIASQVIDTVGDEIERARSAGYTGLRVSADMCWATRPLAGVEQLMVFESEVNELFGDGRLTAICQYDRHRFDPVSLALAAAAHSRAVAATTYHEDPILRICRQHSPPGVRLAGEIDYSRCDVLRHALTEAIRLDRNVFVNLRRLAFIDAAAATVILHAAMGLPADRRMTVVCGGMVAKVLRIVGAAGVPGLRVVADGGT